MKISEEFELAIKNYRFLLNEGFPQKAILKLVGDRYKLSSIERTILYRGICTEINARHRKSKIAYTKIIKNNTIHIDGFNVLITIGSYLNGNPVFIGNDNFLRDASEVHGKVFKTGLINRAISLTFDYLKKQKASGLYLYLDQPVSNSGKLSEKLNHLISEYKFSGLSKTVHSPDYALKEIKQGVIATSDSNIIDKCNVPVFDLARKVISFHFKPKFFNLSKV